MQAHPPLAVYTITMFPVLTLWVKTPTEEQQAEDTPKLS